MHQGWNREFKFDTHFNLDQQLQVLTKQEQHFIKQESTFNTEVIEKILQIVVTQERQASVMHNCLLSIQSIYFQHFALFQNHTSILLPYVNLATEYSFYRIALVNFCERIRTSLRLRLRLRSTPAPIIQNKNKPQCSTEDSEVTILSVKRKRDVEAPEQLDYKVLPEPSRHDTKKLRNLKFSKDDINQLQKAKSFSLVAALLELCYPRLNNSLNHQIIMAIATTPRAEGVAKIGQLARGLDYFLTLGFSEEEIKQVMIHGDHFISAENVSLVEEYCSRLKAVNIPAREIINILLLADFESKTTAIKKILLEKNKEKTCLSTLNNFLGYSGSPVHMSPKSNESGAAKRATLQL